MLLSTAQRDHQYQPRFARELGDSDTRTAQPRPRPPAAHSGAARPGMLPQASLAVLQSLKMAALQAGARTAGALRTSGARQQLVASVHAARSAAAAPAPLAASRALQSAGLRAHGRSMHTTVAVAR